VLGNFDFLTIVEAEDESVVVRAAVEILSRGSIKTATYKAVLVDELIESLK
jgi:uncharacterized protein with GYD domain